MQVLIGRLNAQGLGGADYLIGAERNDVLDGGEGTDAAWGGEGNNPCLTAETGSCTSYPWDTTTTRARVATDRQTRFSDASPTRVPVVEPSVSTANHLTGTSDQLKRGGSARPDSGTGVHIPG